MNSLKRVLILLGLLSALAIILVVVYCIAWKIVFTQNSEYLSTGLGAFFGAAFAFLFLILERFVGRAIERKRKHRNALVKHERMLNEYFNVIGGNIFSIEGFFESAKRGEVYLTDVCQLPIDRDILLDCSDIDYINQTFEINSEALRINQSLLVLVNGYNELRLAFLDGKIDKQTFIVNTTGFFLENLRSLKQTLIDFEIKVENVMALNRVLTKMSLSSIDWAIGFCSQSGRNSKKINNLKLIELNELKKSKAAIIELSKKEIKDREQKLKQQA